MKIMPEVKLGLRKMPDAIAVVTEFEDGTEQGLTQKMLGNGGPSQCLFFDDVLIDAYTVKLRLDFKSLGKTGDPTLDANIFENGKEIPLNSWHNTPKTFDGNEWVYEWHFRGRLIKFKARITSQKNQQGTARIAPAPTSDPPKVIGSKRVFCSQCHALT